jgi:predicted phosphodiesterase
MPKTVMLALLLALAGTAHARTADGTLGVIITPNNGMPAVVRAGDRFEAVLTENLPLTLAGGGRMILVSEEATPLPGGRFSVHCAVPPGTPPGTYAIGAMARTGGEADTTPRAVFVVSEFRDYYVVAHLSDTHIGKVRDGQPDPAAMMAQVIAAVNASDARLAVITGDLTDQGEVGQFQDFLRVLDTCVLPTFVVPGNHDRKDLNYERYFGPLYYHFRHGPDGFLAFDTKDYLTAEEGGPQDLALYRMRRAIRDARWSVGLTHRYEPAMGPRSQWTLFVDDPLDAVFFGHWHRENTDEEKAVPWGTTRFVVTPAAMNGEYRLIDMAAFGIKPRPVQRVP